MQNISNFFQNNDAYRNKLEMQLFPLIHGRGFGLSKHQLPQDILSFLPGLAHDDQSHGISFYKMLHRYSVRLLLHDVLNNFPQCTLADLTHYCSPTSARKFLKEFEEFGIVSVIDDQHIRIHLEDKLNTGWILEWFISSILAIEFGCATVFNVGLVGTQAGGDFDVLASWMGKLLYIESKSAPPKGIHNPEIAAFLERVQNIKPDLAIFINDTHLRVKDKIVLMFEEELIKLKGVQSLTSLPIRRVREQIFQLNHYIYIMNSKRTIAGNLTVVFHDYLQNHLPVGGLL